MYKNILISLLTLSASFYVNAANLYQTDIDKFWGQWWASQKMLVGCESSKNTATFIIDALAYADNSDVTLANSNEIEKLALNEPACLVEGLAKLNDKQLKIFYEFFIMEALFTESDEMIFSIKESRNISKFPNVQKLFK